MQSRLQPCTTVYLGRPVEYYIIEPSSTAPRPRTTAHAYEVPMNITGAAAGDGKRGKRFKKAPSDGMPFCNLGAQSISTVHSYSATMYSSGNGFAIWAGPSKQWNSDDPWRRGTIMIGDVGILQQDGDFLPLFNIFYDREYTREDAAAGRKMPDNFEPIQPPFEEWEVVRQPDHFQPGAIIASEGVQVIESTPDGKSISFSGSVIEGSILVLPQGGSREDLVVTPALYAYIEKQALEWFQFRDGYKKHLKDILTPNGSLYLVTGIDTARVRSSCTFWLMPQRDPEHIPLPVDVGYCRGADRTVWTFSDTIHKDYVKRSWTLSEDDPDFDSETYESLFIRGLRIGLSPTIWEEYLPVDINESSYRVAPGPIVRTGSVESPLPSFVRSIAPAPGVNYSTRAVFHPSFLIMSMMLAKIPKSKWPRMIVIDDAVWLPLLNGKYPTWPVLVDLLSRIFAANKISHFSETMYLSPKTTVEFAQDSKLLWRVISRIRPGLTEKLALSSTLSLLRKSSKLVRLPLKA